MEKCACACAGEMVEVQNNIQDVMLCKMVKGVACLQSLGSGFGCSISRRMLIARFVGRGDICIDFCARHVHVQKCICTRNTTEVALPDTSSVRLELHEEEVSVFNIKENDIIV